MNVNVSTDSPGRSERNGANERKNQWRRIDATIPSPMVLRSFRNEGIFGHQPNSLWPGPWMFHHCLNRNHKSRNPQIMPQQVFKQHQPFGNTGQQAPVGAYPFPPPVHIPQHFYFDNQRGVGRRHNQRQFSHPPTQHFDTGGSNGAASGTPHLEYNHQHHHYHHHHHHHHHQRLSDTRPKGGNGIKGKRKYHWRKKSNSNRGNAQMRHCKEGKKLNKITNDEESEKNCLTFSDIKCINNVHDSESLCFNGNGVSQTSLKEIGGRNVASNICLVKQAEDMTTNSLVDDVSNHSQVGAVVDCEEDQLDELAEGGAVGGVGISLCYGGDKLCNTFCCQIDKDLVDEGAICDFDGMFQNQENFKDSDKNLLCNSDEEQSDSNLFRERKTSVISSEDSESENGAYGGMSPMGHSSYSGAYIESHRDTIPVLKCYRNDDFLEKPQIPVHDSNVDCMRDNQRHAGNAYQQVSSNGNMNDSSGEDNGDFIDTDLPSCNKYILSSSSSDDDGGEREEKIARQLVSSRKKSTLDIKDLNQNDLSTAQRNVFNEFEHLSLRGSISFSEKGFSHNECDLHNDKAQGFSNCDSKSCDKHLCYLKQARHQLNNNDNNCENCDISHANDVTHLPVIGAAACTLPQGAKKRLSDHPGADGESFPSVSQTQFFHADMSSSSVYSLSSSKARGPYQQFMDNTALSASSEQWDSSYNNHPNASAVDDPASGPSFFEASDCYFHEHYPDSVNNFSPFCPRGNGPSANGFDDDSGANFINDESNQYQKVFIKKAIEEKERSGLDPSYSAAVVDNKEMEQISNFAESNNVGEHGKSCSEELFSPDSGDSVEMVLLPMEEQIEPVHFMMGLCPSGGSGSGDEEEGVGQSPGLVNNIQATSSAMSCDDYHCACKDSTPKLINRMPSKEFYELIKSVSASDSYMRFFDKDGKDVQRNSLNAKTDDGDEQYNHQSGVKPDKLKVDRVMIWNEYEAYVVQFKQIAVSACGQTAVLNVMKALKFNCEKSAVCKVIKTNLRKEDKDIPEYLFSRACAGTRASDLKEGIEKLSGGAVSGRFFHFWPPRQVKLLQWLAFWMKRGAIPVATMNLQQGSHSTWQVPDSWHHQMVYGVSDQGLYLTNPLEIISERSAMKQLCSDSVLLVRRQDIISRFQETTDLSQLLDHPDPRWMSMNVLGQVVNVLRECNMPSMPGYRLQVTSHVCIPASYQAGILLFMPKDKGAWKSLMAAPDLPLDKSSIPSV